MANFYTKFLLISMIVRPAINISLYDCQSTLLTTLLAISIMSAGESQHGQSAAIREEVRRTIQQLNEMAQSERNFDQFCEAVLSKVVKITGAHGALLWQVNGNEMPN